MDAPRGLIILCGRYEAIDERLFRTLGLIDAELSVGDVVLSGGELAAMGNVGCVAALCARVY